MLMLDCLQLSLPDSTVQEIDVFPIENPEAIASEGIFPGSLSTNTVHLPIHSAFAYTIFHLTAH